MTENQMNHILRWVGYSIFLMTGLFGLAWLLYSPIIGRGLHGVVASWEFRVNSVDNMTKKNKEEIDDLELRFFWLEKNAGKQ